MIREKSQKTNSHKNSNKTTAAELKQQNPLNIGMWKNVGGSCFWMDGRLIWIMYGGWGMSEWIWICNKSAEYNIIWK